MLDTIVSIILFVVAFGVLICIHEAGHLSMAKLFKVYCKEYSIGFGPAIFSKKDKNKETTFSIRAIPFGGYVAMYGEGLEDDPEFKDIPKERSLEGIKKWKKAIIISAGVILNAILAFVLIFISDVAFPAIKYTREAKIAESSLIAEAGIAEGEHLSFVLPDSYKKQDGTVLPFTYEFTDESQLIHSANFYIVDENVTLGDGTHYVLTYMFTGNKKEPNFSAGISLYPAIHKIQLDEKLVYNTQLEKDFIDWSTQENSPEYYPNFEAGPYTPKEGSRFSIRLKFDEQIDPKTIEISVNSREKGRKKTLYFTDIGLSFKVMKVWAPFGQRLKWTFQDYGSAAGAVFKGLKVLFTGGIKNMSGIVGIFDASATLYSSYTFSTYLFFWGLISVNLAIFNLLPFPGLDGWQLLVTAVEGITRKKLPNKFKTIMSIIGLGLLLVLMVVIVVLDVIRIIG